MTTISFKGLACVVLVGLAAAIVACIPFRKALVVLSESPGPQASLKRPNILKRLAGSQSVIEFDLGTSVWDAVLLDTLLEEPVALMPGSTHTEVFCIYDFDVGFRVIVLDSEKQYHESDDDLRIIVRRSKLGVRHARSEEVRAIIGRIEAMSDDTFRRYSFPAVDLGPVKLWPTRPAIVSRLQDELDRRRLQAFDAVSQ